MKPLINLVLVAAALAPVSASPAAAAHRNAMRSPDAGQRENALNIAKVSAPSRIAAYAKFEIAFEVLDTAATNLQFPYEPAPPPGIDVSPDGLEGISVDALFTPDNWRTVYRQPGFFYQRYTEPGALLDREGKSQMWRYPEPSGEWRVRFTPHIAGAWQFVLAAVDASGSTKTAPGRFTVEPSTRSGFIRVSKRDPRYFEFDDGTLFFGPGLNVASTTPAGFSALQRNRISLVRTWISSLYGSAWLRWRGARNIHDGYLPRAGILPVHGGAGAADLMALRLNYPVDWFDDCYTDSGGAPQAVKRNTAYLVSIRYRGERIGGPRVSSDPAYGLVARFPTSQAPGCSEAATGERVTGFGGNTSDWATIQGVWRSGERDFLPPLSIALENVREGRADVASISVREILDDGRLGPEVLEEPSMQYERYYPEHALRSMDDQVEQAENSGVYLKLVLLEKNDVIFSKLDKDGTFVIDGEQDNHAGVYGLGRGLNRTRWLQRAWWRYVTARWGYSPAIHSWELFNEGDPGDIRHWEMADEFGKFMHCQVYGVNVAEGDGAKCSYEHPNRHLVTTSFWFGFPGFAPKTGRGFWGNPKYPNLDYADVHAYISTSPAPEADKAAMETDAAYYHLWHSREYGSWKLKFPVVRGEAGVIPRGGSTDGYAGLGLQRDVQGVWFHNFVWSALDSGALYEIYWYTDPHVVDAGRYDHRPVALSFHNFISSLPLNNGGYRELDAQVSGADLRVVGQKDTANNRAHLWIQNSNHTWKNTVDGADIPPVSGDIRIGGFDPNRAYALEWWDTHKTASQVISTSSLDSKPDGSLTVRIDNLASDVALKITPTEPR